MNRVDLIGRITKGLDLKQSQSGSAWATFTLAVNRSRKVQGQPDADFIRCKAFGKTAENLCRYMGKGSQIAVSGSIQTGSYNNQQGQKIYTTDVMVQEVTFLEPRKAAAPQNGYQANNYASNGYQSAQDSGDGDYGYDTDDMPF